MIKELASLSDSLKLSDFFKSFPIPGHVAIQIDRKENFFEPYKIQGEMPLTYVLKDPTTQEIHGMASFVCQEVSIQNKIVRISFGRDLRIAPNRKAIISWSDHFLPTMKEVQKTHQSEYCFSILNQNEIKAMNAFVRPRQMKRPMPRYFLYRKFNLISVHGKFPWASNPLPHLEIRRGSPLLEADLIEYLCEKGKSRDLAQVFNQESFYEKLVRWKGLRLEDFLIAFDNKGKIVGCTAPWSAGGIEDMIPLQYSIVGHNFRQFLKFGSLFGWTRKLTKPISRLKHEAPLVFKYLTFLNADNEDIFETLLWHAYEMANKNEFLVYTQIKSDRHLRRPFNWITAKNPFNLYAMLSPNEEIPEFLRPSNDRTIEIEPFQV